MGMVERLRAAAREADARLYARLDALAETRHTVFDAMRHSAHAGGKRLRMTMLMESARLFDRSGGNGSSDNGNGGNSEGGDGCDAAANAAAPPEARWAFACALEMIHTYSLIHDDLPCMDDADTRRGRPACHVAFGECAAVLAGDGLLHFAFETMAGAALALPPAAMRGALHALDEIARGAGTQGMLAGQALDTALEGQPLDIATLQEVNDKKTGALFLAAMRAGAFLGGAGAGVDSTAGADALRRVTAYARGFGRAFQIVDDILDQTGDPQKTGKPQGGDAAAGKVTAASLLGIDAALARALSELEAAKTAIAPLDKYDFFIPLCDYVSNREF